MRRVTGVTSTGLEVALGAHPGHPHLEQRLWVRPVADGPAAGPGLGQPVQWGWSRRRGDSWRRLALCQWLLAGVTLATVPCSGRRRQWLERCCDGSSAAPVFLGELGLTAAALFLPAVLMGMSLPLLAGGVTGDAETDSAAGWAASMPSTRSAASPGPS